MCEMKGLDGSNPPLSTIQSLSFRTSRRIDRNPRAYACLCKGALALNLTWE